MASEDVAGGQRAGGHTVPVWELLAESTGALLWASSAFLVIVQARLGVSRPTAGVAGPLLCMHVCVHSICQPHGPTCSVCPA